MKASNICDNVSKSSNSVKLNMHGFKGKGRTWLGSNPKYMVILCNRIYISEPYVIPYKYVHDAIWPLYVVTTVHIEGDFAKSYLLLNKIGSFQIMCPVLRCLGHKGLMVEYYRCLSKGVGWGWTWWCLYMEDKIDWIIRRKDGQYVITLHNQRVVF